MLLTRNVLGCCFCLLAIALSSCSTRLENSSSGKPKTDKGTTEPTTSTGAIMTAKELLKSISANQVDFSKLSPDFKKLIGPPTSSADKERGYSEWSINEWVKTFAKRVPTSEPQEIELASGVLAVIAPGNATSGPAVLRFTKYGPDWLVDWLHIGPDNLDGKLTSKDKAAEFATVAFLQTVLADQLTLSETLLTPSLKARIAPPLPGDEGFNKTTLKNKLLQLRGSATTYTINKLNFGADAGNADGVLTVAAGKPSDSRPFSIKLVKGTKPGEWLIDDFEPR